MSAPSLLSPIAVKLVVEVDGNPFQLTFSLFRTSATMAAFARLKL